MPTLIRQEKSAGFTLMELMVAVAVVGILAAIAFPSYQNQIRKSRRTEARSALLDIASREERLFSTTNAYSATPADVGYTTLTPVGSGYYNVTITNIGVNPATFLITATPAVGSQSQDTSCAMFSVTQAGVQFAQDIAGTDTTATCWK